MSSLKRNHFSLKVIIHGMKIEFLQKFIMGNAENFYHLEVAIFQLYIFGCALKPEAVEWVFQNKKS